MNAKEKAAYEKGRADGFVQGQAWAAAVMLRYELRPDEVVHQAGITRAMLYEHKVDAYDRKPILKQFREESAHSSKKSAG